MIYFFKKILFPKISFFTILYVWAFCLHLHLCATCMLGARGFGEPPCGAGNQTKALYNSSSLNHQAHFKAQQMSLKGTSSQSWQMTPSLAATSFLWNVLKEVFMLAAISPPLFLSLSLFGFNHHYFPFVKPGWFSLSVPLSDSAIKTPICSNLTISNET